MPPPKDTTNPAAIAAAHAAGQAVATAHVPQHATEARITRFAPSRHDELKTSTESAHPLRQAAPKLPSHLRTGSWALSPVAIFDETTKGGYLVAVGPDF